MSGNARLNDPRPATSARILYLGFFEDAPVQKMKLAGARRYADARRWEVVPFEKSDSGPRQIGALLARHRPVGCIADCSGKEPEIPPSLFGRVPVVWLDIPSGAPDGQPSRRSVFVDNGAVAMTAMRELSAIRPESFAVVDFQWYPHEESPAWAVARMAAFKATVSAAGRPCAALAARFDCSRRLFNMRFREATGHSVLDEILHVRLERAFTLLAKTDTAIGAIPQLCGFRTNRALDFLFHSRFNSSMSEWRKRNSRI